MPREFMPIMRAPDFRLPWSLIAPHEAQAIKNHGQTLERLAERGGLGFAEAAAILEDRDYRPICWPGQEPSQDAARSYLALLMARLTAGVRVPGNDQPGEPK